MDQDKYNALMDALKEVPDPHRARGKCYPWSFLLTLICAALSSGQQKKMTSERRRITRYELISRESSHVWPGT